MKTTPKTGLLMAMLLAAVSFSSCSVEYRTRHPKPKKKVIVVGKIEQPMPVNTVDASSAKTNGNKTNELQKAGK